MSQHKIRFDSKEEFDSWSNLCEKECPSARYHSFGEEEPWEYPCVMTAVVIENEVDSIEDVYYCFVYRRNLIDY